jgi:hypothetical protein
MYGIPDRLDYFYKGVLVASTGGLVSGTGTLQWAYAPAPGDPSWCLVVMAVHSFIMARRARLAPTALN